ncbi:CMRF35-like molecule 7 [Oryctolagus cuniculus]|uniref:CMRF35-like molecule 7 n=1 Tax=Oryctolagus cuniculus TaxID=9986 RepID=UPI003879FC19
MWLPPALLLLSLPGCFFIQGPGTVTAVEQGSMTVQCHYRPGWESYSKWWCRGRIWSFCQVLVQTSGTEQEERSGRVSIRDNHRDRSITVTMEGLRQDDADTYWCGIKRVGTDRGTRVMVTIDPGENSVPQGSGPQDPQGLKGDGWEPSTWTDGRTDRRLGREMGSQAPPSLSRSLPGVLLAHSRAGRVRGGEHHCPCLVGSTNLPAIPSTKSPARPTATSNMGPASGSYNRGHYLLLVFVKVPVLLVLASIVLWLKGSRRVLVELRTLAALGNTRSPLPTDHASP